MTLGQLNLDHCIEERQLRAFEAWIGTLDQTALEEAVEEDCVVGSPFTWEFRTTGLGPTVVVWFGKVGIDLSIDDDNNLSNRRVTR